MSDDFLDPKAASEEDRVITEMAARLQASRPVPSAAFRGELRRTLLSGRIRSRPRALWLRVAAASGSGFVLLGTAALGVLGAGPLAS
jgi:hypothetical protein